MSNAVMAIGIIIILLGGIGLFGWISAFNEMSSELFKMQQKIERSAQGVSVVGGFISLFIPQYGEAMNNAAESTVNNFNKFKETITMFFYYNIMLNIALMLCGIGLVSVGRDLGVKESKVQKIRKYLKKNKE